MKKMVLWLMVAGLMGSAGVAYAVDPPAGMLLWFKADTEVIESGGVVQEWWDQSGNFNDAIRQVGTMQLTTATFPIGDLPVIRFKRDGFFKLTDWEATFIPDLTIYAVVEQTGAGERRSYFSTYSNYVNWGYGYHCDFEGGNTRVFTSAGTSATSSDWVISAPALPNGYHYMTVAISGTAGSKSIYTEGVLRGTTTVPGISFHASSGCSIGTLGSLPMSVFYFRGGIAEIIVYPSVDSAQKNAVELYLSEKYGLETPPEVCGDWGYYAYDFNHNCYVDFSDLATFAASWLTCTLPDEAGGVDCVDLVP